MGFRRVEERIMENTEEKSRVISVRVPVWVYEAYEQIQVVYNVKQSELLRMSPLLFLLLAEKNLNERQGKLNDWEKKLKGSGPFDWDWTEIREIDQERLAVSNNEVLGKKFVDTLKDLAKNVHNSDAISPEKIELEKGEVVPKYSIFQHQTLRQVATEIAALVRKDEIDNILNREDNRYDLQLLAASGKKLGLLDDKQKQAVRDEFFFALETRKEFGIKNQDDTTASLDDLLWEAAFEVARNIVHPNDVKGLLKQIREGGVPHRYDSWLFTKSRQKIGRPLRAKEKSLIRDRFRAILNNS